MLACIASFGSAHLLHKWQTRSAPLSACALVQQQLMLSALTVSSRLAEPPLRSLVIARHTKKLVTKMKLRQMTKMRCCFPSLRLVKMFLLASTHQRRTPPLLLLATPKRHWLRNWKVRELVALQHGQALFPPWLIVAITYGKREHH